MIFVGIDDTDMPETPGTNKLAFHLAERLAAEYRTQWIVRHQLLEDPRVPCTNKNGCVSLLLEPIGLARIESLCATLREEIVAWSPPGSDPGLCVAERVPATLTLWGRRTQGALVERNEALILARKTGVLLEPLGGTGGGVIGALAAVGLLATWNSGRVVHCARFRDDASEKAGCYDVTDVYGWGIDDIQTLDDNRRVTAGRIDLGKRLRPNLRNGRVVLFVAHGGTDDPAEWMAQRVVA